MKDDSSKIISECNVSSHLGDEHGLQEVIEQMISKLKQKSKSVKDFNTP